MVKEKVHFEAPNSELIEKEMKLFLNWINSNEKIGPVIKLELCNRNYILKKGC